MFEAAVLGLFCVIAGTLTAIDPVTVADLNKKFLRACCMPDDIVKRCSDLGATRFFGIVTAAIGAAALIAVWLLSV